MLGKYVGRGFGSTKMRLHGKGRKASNPLGRPLNHHELSLPSPGGRGGGGSPTVQPKAAPTPLNDKDTPMNDTLTINIDQNGVHRG